MTAARLSRAAAAPKETATVTDAGERQRLDRWLWFARMARTRTLAAKLVAAGHVRIGGRRVENPARAIRIGDVLTLALPGATRVVMVRSTGLRRGPAAEAVLLYEDVAARDDASLARDGESR